jgi:hypothetical protein
MIVIFVHGWSVRNTDTYGGLPRYVATQQGADGKPFKVANIYLGRYISFNDTVTVDDISRAFDYALRQEFSDKVLSTERIACITHSTGGPVIRNWIDLYYRKNLSQCPLTHLVMLAPANHGSALAQLGKSRLSRMKSIMEGAVEGQRVEPGERVLDWLESGSAEAWELNERWLDYDCVSGGLFPFVLTGQTIDRSFYDALNSYTDEMGSDGVVRAAAANLNYSFLELYQDGDNNLKTKKIWRSKPTAFGILPKLSHSGDEIGIIRSVSPQGLRPVKVAQQLGIPREHPTAEWVVKCLQVNSASQYEKLAAALSEVTLQTQKAELIEKHRTLLGTREYRHERCTQIIVRLCDDRGQPLSDYDLYLTAGPKYSEQELPPGFFVDRQRNRRNPGKLTYYLNWDAMERGLQTTALKSKIGFRIEARPKAGPDALAYYKVLDFRSDLETLERALRPNETVMFDIELKRCVDAAVFRISNDLTPGKIDGKPLGKNVT